MSGRWGHRPLGRGGWRVIAIRSWLGFSGRSAALASSKANPGANRFNPRGQAASDYRSSFRFAASPVDSPRVSFAAVLFRGTEVLRVSTEVLSTPESRSNFAHD